MLRVRKPVYIEISFPGAGCRRLIKGDADLLRPARNKLAKVKLGFTFGYRSGAYAPDLAARLWAARKH